MKKILLAATSLLLMASAANAQQFPYTLYDCSISSLTGSSQQIIAANPQRKYLMIFNSGANPAYVNLAGGTAATSGASSVALSVGASIVVSGPTISTSKVTAIGTAAQPLTCYEGR